MKKLLMLLGAIGLTTTTTTSVIACGNQNNGLDIDILDFKIKAEIETIGKYETIEETIEPIKNITELPIGVESIQVSIFNFENIEINFSVEEGYKTPASLILKFYAKGTIVKTEIKTTDIEDIVKTKDIYQLNNLAAVNEKLAEVKIPGVLSLIGRLSLNNYVDVSVRILINENTHYLTGANSFVIEKAIKQNFPRNATVYVDASGKEIATQDQNLATLNTTTIKQIGFFKNKAGEIQVPRMPTRVKEMPMELPEEVTSLEGMFIACGDFDQDISGWDVSNITNMRSMFYQARVFNQDLSSWDVSNVANMNAMFSNAKKFNQPLDSWDVSKVTSMDEMFNGASSFDQKLSSWNTSNVTSMNEIFGYASNFNSDISSWDVSNITDMKFMFFEAENFNQDLSAWDVSNVTNMNAMFWYAESFNQDIASWNVSNVTNMRYMFTDAKKFIQDISSWNVKSVESYDNFDQDTNPNWVASMKPNFLKNV